MSEGGLPLITKCIGLDLHPRFQKLKEANIQSLRAFNISRNSLGIALYILVGFYRYQLASIIKITLYDRRL